MKKSFLFLLLTVLSVCTASCVQELPSDTLAETPAYTSGENVVHAPPETDSPLPPILTSCSLLSFTVPAEKNKNMCEDLVGQIIDDTITLPITAPTDTFSLKNAVIEIQSDAEAVTFSSANGDTVDLTAPDCTLVLTDKSGLSRTYRILLSHAPHTIPVISIVTETGEEITTKDSYINAVISIDTAGVNGWYLPDGFASLPTTDISIKGRGNSTWQWEKKPYKFKFKEKTSVLGLTEEKTWVLLANYADYSLIRNYTAFEAAKVLSPALAPLSQFPVNVFINGEYRGIYSIGEDKEVTAGRIDLEKDNGTDDTSYLLEIGGFDSEDVLNETAFSTEFIRYCSIEYPEEEALTQTQLDYIYNYCKKADAAVKSLDGYEEYIDVDSLIDWFILNELFYNLESCFRRSCFLTKEPGEKLKMGPIWDFDLAVGNLYNDFGNYRAWACLSQSYNYIEDNWFCYLLRDSVFRDALKERWDEIKDVLLARVLYCIDGMSETLTPHAAYNFTRWNILGTRAVLPQPLHIETLKSYEDNVRYVRDFLINRWTWMDKNI